MNIFEIEVKLLSGKDCMVYHNPIKFQYNGCSCKVYRYLEDALEEIKQYKTIGTPDECRAAMEKQKAKKPSIYKETNRADCPVCGATVRGIGKAFGDWCIRCGQKLDWSDEE